MKKKDIWKTRRDKETLQDSLTDQSVALCNAKSSARLLCPPERMSEFVGWDTPYVHDTVTVLSSDSGTFDEMR